MILKQGNMNNSCCKKWWLRKLVCLLMVTGFALVVTAQNIRFNMPNFADKVGKLYYFRGNKTDSMAVTFDQRGNASVKMPATQPRWLVIFSLQGQGYQFIAGEPDITLSCTQAQLSRENVVFSNSPENEFLYRTFVGKSKLMSKLQWLKAGVPLYPANEAFGKMLQREEQQASTKLSAVNAEIEKSDLYAARFLSNSAAMEDLFQAEQAADSIKAKYVRHYMETTFDFVSHYTVGTLWSSVPNFYISMFNRVDKSTKREDFVSSACKILDRIQGEPYYSELLCAFITETERFGWLGSGQAIVQHALSTHPSIKEVAEVSPEVKRLISMVDASSQKQATPLKMVALNADGTVNESVSVAPLSLQGGGDKLVIFYETGCEFCEHEIDYLKTHFADFKAKGVRIISVSSDVDWGIFQSGSKDFPWADKLYDSKGFLGENFKNYGVLGTPTIFSINGNGMITGRYSMVKEANLLDQ